MKKLVVLWKSDNLVDIEEMITPYIIASKKNKWWDEVEVIIWGASQKVVATDDEVKRKVALMMKQNINVYACKKCAEDLGIEKELSSQHINVMYTGELLTEFLQSDAKVITL
ncbi:MAG: hypothetical protein RQ856_06295 [Candidatus Izemoplasmatales bacterium]|nr:hypothetical protein [Candidatus Izemoplasmatales bacterium]